jgi:hypothetical protein
MPRKTRKLRLPIAISELEDMCNQGCHCGKCANKGPLSEIFMMQKCHEGAGLELLYTRGSGVLTVTCRHCHKTVERIAVALISVWKKFH